MYLKCNCFIKEMYFHVFLLNLQDKQVPVKVMEVIEEELTKLSFLEQHSSEFK